MLHHNRILVKEPFLALGIIGIFAPLCPAPQPQPQRIVFLGDSITDGNTYPLLVRQAITEAGKSAPVCINAGLAGDTAAGIRKRLERDVLSRQPTLVSISVGINDVLRGVKVADYEADLSAIAGQLRANKIPMLIMTTSVLGPKHAAADQRLAEFNAALRRLAEKHGCRVADVNRLMQEARKSGRNLLEDDQVHLSFDGYRVLTRAVLDGLGYKDVPVPPELKLDLMPGVIRDWRLRAVSDKEPAPDEKTIAGVKPDSGWKTYRLPEPGPVTHWWLDQERKRGFAVSVDKLMGAAKSYLGIAYLDEKEPRKVFCNTGAQLQAIWLNGKRIYRNTDWTGWHAGKERVPAELKAGRNTVVIETGGQFFLSITDDDQW